MRISTLQGVSMSSVGEWLLRQPPYVGLPLTFGLSLVTGLILGTSVLRVMKR